jgi:GalNAc-alpha-(1->4)-GalNAc-alpha-(1->3)-diNAcBac-PP-undecaprenol alpha-1,4-N-acetyl-D-galactosaminyltransferase
MKLTLISSSLEVGSIERVVSIIANYWATRGWKITILTLDDGLSQPFYDLDRQIDLLPLGIKGLDTSGFAAIRSNLRKIGILRKAIVTSRPDVVISFVNMTNILTLLACWGLKIKTIAIEDVYPTFGGLNKVAKFLQKLTYRWANLIGVQTHSALSFFPVSEGYNTYILPHPVEIPSSETIESRINTDDRYLLAVGKLTHQKGFDILIKAFAQICDRHPDWNLTILGEGEMRSDLENLCTELNLNDVVHLAGNVKNIDAYFHKADIFASASRFEGFPLALGEAMACGVPVISTDCHSGPREMIHDGIDGILVVSENVNALAAGLDLLMSDPVKRQYLSHHAPKILKRFGVKRAMSTWTNAVKQVVSNN